LAGVKAAADGRRRPFHDRSGGHLLQAGGQKPAGAYETQATFTQMVAGRSSGGRTACSSAAPTSTAANQKYTYFVVRQDGKYLIKRRAPEKRRRTIADWTDSPAIQEGRQLRAR